MFQTTYNTLAMSTLVLLPVLLFILFFVFYQEFPGYMDALGLEKREISLLLAGSLVGVMLNVPMIIGDGVFFGLNVGGALIPIVLSLHLLWKHRPNVVWIIISVGLVSIASYYSTEFFPNLGIASFFPYYLGPPLLAFALARIMEKRVGPALALAYSAGTLGALIGADLVRIPMILAGSDGEFMGAIGGAGSLDMVFLAGLMAGGLVLITSPRELWTRKKETGEVERHLIPKQLLVRAKEAYNSARYGASIQHSKQALESQIFHTASRYGITGDPEECLFGLRVLPYMIHDYRATHYMQANQEDAWRAYITSKLLVKDLRRIEREMYQGLAIRAVAYIVDAIIVLTLLTLVSIPLFRELGSIDIISSQAMVILLTLIGLGWAMETGYFTLQEWLWGRSIGKRLFGMRVMDENGNKCGFMAAFTRNVLRILDIAAILMLLTLPFYIILYQHSERKQRIGDF